MRARLAAIGDAILSLAAWLVFAFALALVLSRDTYVAGDTNGRVRFHVRRIEFDFVGWTALAVEAKLAQASVGEQSFLSEADRGQVVREFFALRADLDGVEAAIATSYADPAIADPDAATANLRAQEADLRLKLRHIQGPAEAVLSEQLSVILAEQGLAAGGQPVPPVAFRFTPLPYALIVSPRSEIRQESNIDVSGDLTLDEQDNLEQRIEADLDVSALIVPLGGIGTYPTMVLEDSSLTWIASIVAHEWIHNYLTLRPLGMNYLVTDNLRTMNESTAELAGNELGILLVERYYPDLAPPPPAFTNSLRRDEPLPAEAVAAFDFRAEMHTTRLAVDRLLAEGRIDEAEAYMEARRRILWDHGYQIRKLNQAYFAFYGAYAAAGGGASGGDPVGAAVRLLRRRSPTIAEFVNRIAWLTSYDQLREYLRLPPG